MSIMQNRFKVGSHSLMGQWSFWWWPPWKHTMLSLNSLPHTIYNLQHKAAWQSQFCNVLRSLVLFCFFCLFICWCTSKDHHVKQIMRMPEELHSWPSHTCTLSLDAVFCRWVSPGNYGHGGLFQSSTVKVQHNLTGTVVQFTLFLTISLKSYFHGNV